MSIYKANTIKLSRKDAAEFKKFALTQEQLILVIRQFGYSVEETIDLVNNNHVQAIDELVRCRLFLIFRSDNLTALAEALEHEELRVIPIDRCNLLYIGPPNEQPLNKYQLNEVRKTLGRLHPDLVDGFTFNMMGPDGPLTLFKSYDMLAFENIKNYFLYNNKWLSEQKRWISPLFEQVYKEIGDYLRVWKINPLPKRFSKILLGTVSGSKNKLKTPLPN